MSGITVVGAGYVGLVTAACFSKLGNKVFCLDMDPNKIEVINQGRLPISEPGLLDLIRSNPVTATTDYQEAISHTNVSFLCVNTPVDENWNVDLSFILKAAESVASVLKNKETFHVIVVKSTVLPGTTENEVKSVIEQYSRKLLGDFGLAVNPEFLQEGNAVHNFLHPDKIVIGADDQKSLRLVSDLYRDFEGGCPCITTNMRTAETIKYANNLFLATKISFSNELGNICKKLGVDTYTVMDAIGYDSRIGRSFLNAGLGFGGACLPKDLKGFIQMARDSAYVPELFEAVLRINDHQPRRLVELLENKIDLEGKQIAILGVAFKEGTDDIRESRALIVMTELVKKGAFVRVYDPVVTQDSLDLSGITFCNTVQEALEGADACLVTTGWSEFTQLRDEFKLMKGKIIIDGRNMINRDIRALYDYEGLAW